MKDLAAAFVGTCETAGHHLETSVESARRLGAVIDDLLARDQSYELEQAVAQGAAAYLGEVVIQAGKAAWALEPETEDVILAMLPDGVPVIYLVALFDKWIARGTTHDVVAFLDECLTGFTRPTEA